MINFSYYFKKVKNLLKDNKKKYKKIKFSPLEFFFFTSIFIATVIVSIVYNLLEHYYFFYISTLMFGYAYEKGKDYNQSK